ncbi:MAG: response regulator, partial [Prolixibacteraceae bacterium]|nr:response regulator [Prolixibacteraceae bacterium]
FGSSFGLIKLLGVDGESAIYENYSEIEGLPNNTIHGILEDDRGYLWLSTNNGIVQFDAERYNFKILNSKNGLNVTEFSDGAYYKNMETGVLLFGGTNGFVTVEQDIFVERNFTPPIYFTGLKIYDKEQNINDFIKHDKKRGKYLELKHEQNFFYVSFIALDYIHGHNRTYSYNLENLNEKWIDNHNANEIKFTNLSPGRYVLHVRSKNNAPDFVESACNLPIVILPPWYLSVWAISAYAVLSLLFVSALTAFIRRSYHRKREVMIERLKQEHKEKVYESKLRFFTNITHEFSTPLTLIYGPCTRIMSYAGSDSYVKEYASLIQKNAERLNTLIQELIEFRKIETGNRQCEIEQLFITDLAFTIADSFAEFAETRSIDYRISIGEKMFWNSDKSCFTKIITNLLSNAFKYTPDGGKIECRVATDGRELQIVVSNSGKGISPEDIPYVFDRYRVLENFEQQSRKGAYSRHGLGLAICHNMVKLLQGEIDVVSNPNIITEFTVSLPMLDVTEKKNTNPENILPPPHAKTEDNEVKTENYKFIKSRQTILVVDDEHEMLWFIAEIFRDSYNIIPIEDSTAVLPLFEEIHPDLILSDIMMPNLDGISLLKQIKADKRTSHIPFILISAKNSSEEQVEGIAAGAEAYITKPFNADYLKSLVNRLLQRQDDLKEYFRSAQSAFKLEDGKYIHTSDKEFFNKVIATIDRHITDPDFSTEKLASLLSISARQLYRRLKNCTDQTPHDLIRDYRLTVAEKLLLNTRLSIDEIIYKVGFSSRNSFYRLFTRKYDMSPKNYREEKRKILPSPL